MLGAERVIAIDRFPERLQLARDFGHAETLNYEEVDLIEALKQMTGGRGPDSCIDAVGMEAHSDGPQWLYDRTKQIAHLSLDRPIVIRQAIQACRKGGTVSLVGVYAGFIDKVPMGAAFNKGLTLKMGQMFGQKYVPMLLERIQRGEIDPSQLASHHMSLDEAPEAYKMFKHKDDNCIRVVFKP
jgi:threonine dehydrogenase-like Zn-dependent dehydrogenase